MTSPNVVYRAQWGARQPKNPPVRIATPVPDIYIHHSDTAADGDIAAIVRGIQNYHMDNNGWNDIGYSWLVDQAGDAHQGRGWGIEGAHTLNHNTTAHGICLIGNYQVDTPTDAQIATVQWLITVGRQFGEVGHGVVGGHRDVYATDCPGDKAYPLIGRMGQTWVDPANPSPQPVPQTPRYNPPIHLDDIADTKLAPGGGLWQLAVTGAIYAWEGAPYAGSAFGRPYFTGHQACRFVELNENEKAAGKVYVFEDHYGGRYAYPE